MNPLSTLAIALLVAVGTPLAGRADDDPSKHPKNAPKTAQPGADMTEAEVRKIDKANKKITLKHGETENLDMPAMTMVFQVNDRALLERFKAGDKVRFRAEKIGGAYTVTVIEGAK